MDAGMGMLSADKNGLLRTFLGGLPGHVAARLAMAVEVDRMMDGRALPHAEILTSLRPALRQERQNQRAPTPLRLFCRPFEDILTCVPRKAKQKADIARSTVEPAWCWIAGTLVPDQASAFVHETRALLVARNLDAALERTIRFWPVAAQAMQQALAEPRGRKAAERVLGDSMAVADAAEMALLLSAGPVMLRLHDVLPAPVPSLTEPLLWELRAIYDDLVQSQPDVAPYVAVVAMNRLARPCEALRLPLQVTRHTDDTLISKTDMGLVGEILFARMDALKNAIQMTRHPLFDAEMLAEQVKSFADLSSGITREIDLKREGQWGKRLLADRAGIGRVMDGFMERAPREVLAALPLVRGSGPKAADFSRTVPDEKRQMALRYGRLVAMSRNFAAAASFAARQKAAEEEIGNEIRRYVEDLLRALREPAHPHITVARAQFELCVELVAMLFSETEAELLRRRGRAAQAAA
jgi:hypothetical protein